MPKCQTPFFVWFTGRTGSTLLCDLLDSHSQIYCRKEDFSEINVAGVVDAGQGGRLVETNGGIFFRRMFTPDDVVDDPSPRSTVEYLEQIFSAGNDACGFKLKFPTQPAVYPEIVEHLRLLPQLKVVELVRENVLKQAISLRNVQRINQLGTMRSGNSIAPIDLAPLVLDVELTIKHANYFLRSRTEFREFANSFSSVMNVSYEELYCELDETLGRVLSFLGVDENEKLQSKYQKTTPDQIRDAISNYDELAIAVAGTELEQFLD